MKPVKYTLLSMKCGDKVCFNYKSYRVVRMNILLNRHTLKLYVTSCFLHFDKNFTDSLTMVEVIFIGSL
jgi:hypothetical protein